MIRAVSQKVHCRSGSVSRPYPYADVNVPVQLTLENLDPLTKLQSACLDFCIELLNQQIDFNEYECPLLTALAVQEVTEILDAWCARGILRRGAKSTIVEGASRKSSASEVADSYNASAAAFLAMFAA